MDFGKIKTYTQEVIAAHAQRDTMFRDLERIFLLEDMGDLPRAEWIKTTRHPDARNSLLGAVRLMTATDPHFSISEEYNPDEMASQASRLEKIVAMLWSAAGRVRKKPVHYDAVLSGLLYGEVQIAVKSVKQMLAANPTSKRLQAIYQRTPVIFDVINPAAGYPVFDELGMRCYVSSQMRSVGEINSIYKSPPGLQNRKDTDRVQVFEYWDFDQHVVWVEGGDRPIVDEPNGWDFVPIVAQICEGSELFGTSRYSAGIYQTRHPFLYTLWKSNLIYRMNLSLTLQSSLAFAIGANPLFVYRRNNPAKSAPEVDFSQPGGRVVIDNDESYEPLARQVIDSSVREMDELYRNLATESTIYRQTLGEPLGANAPFSMVALLSQAGRLPLVPYQRTISWAIGDAVQTALQILKAIGESSRIATESGYIDLDVNDIPDEFEITATLDIDMPQDERMNAMIALQLTQGENPLTSLETARSRYLRIEQPDEEQYKIWSERAAQARFMAMLQEEMMMAQQGMQPPEGTPPEGTPPPEGMPPEDMGAAQGGAGMGIPGVPMQEPLQPPMQPPEGEGLGGL